MGSFDNFYEAILKLEESKQLFEKGIEQAKHELLTDKARDCLRQMGRLTQSIRDLQFTYQFIFIEIEYICDPDNYEK